MLPCRRVTAGSSTAGCDSLGEPAIEFLRRIDDHADQHVGVLRAAIFGALAEVQAGFFGLKHQCVHATGIRSTLPASRGTQKL